MAKRAPKSEALTKLTETWLAADKSRNSSEPRLLGLLRHFTQKNLPFNPELLNAWAQLFGEWFTPHPIILFSKALLKRLESRSVLDPSAGTGIFAGAVAHGRPAKGLGLIKDPQSLEVAQLLTGNADLSWKLGDPLALLDDINETFEAVISNLPFGTRRVSTTISSKEQSLAVSDEEGLVLLLKSALRLSPKGIGLYVVPDKFFAREDDGAVRLALPGFGLRIAASMSVPWGSFRPLTTIGANLIVIERGAPTELFVGELSTDPDRTAILLDNFLARRDGAELALGRLSPLRSFTGYGPLVAADRLEKMVKEFGAPKVALSDIAIDFNLANSENVFPQRANSVYLPLIGLSPAIADLAEGKLKPHNYVQIVLNEGVADARYLAGFFNTALGLAIRESLQGGTVIPKISKASIQQGFVYLPPRDIQTQTVRGATALTNAANQIREYQQRLWSDPQNIHETLPAISAFEKGESFPGWLDHLPFPLASILWTYHASGPDPKVRYEHLLHFFEALAEFTATILLSGFSSQPNTFEQDRIKLRSALQEVKLSLDYGTFGTWKTIVDYLGKRGRSLFSGDPADTEFCKSLFSCRDAEVLEILFSKSLAGLIQETNSSRNSWIAHGGIVGSHVAEERHAILSAGVANLRDLFGNKWDSFELVQPRNCRVRNGIFENQVDRLMGPRVPFELVERKTTEPLETGGLYFLPKYESRGLRIVPLVKIMPAPRTAQNACYFYNRRQKDQKIRFVSYHFEQEAELIDDFEDTLQILRLISEK